MKRVFQQSEILEKGGRINVEVWRLMGEDRGASAPTVIAIKATVHTAQDINSEADASIKKESARIAVGDDFQDCKLQREGIRIFDEMMAQAKSLDRNFSKSKASL